MIDLDRPCPHDDFVVQANVVRLAAETGGPCVGFMAELEVRCAACDERFRWMGVPAGLLADRPACSPDEFELRAPIRPSTADPDFGMGLPGFAMRMLPPEEGPLELGSG